MQRTAGAVVAAIGLILACEARPTRRPHSAEPSASSTRIDSNEPQYRRIVCGSPAVTEIVFALGAGERVVGVSDYVVFPPEACGKERIGGLTNPNRERLLVLTPDLIITQGSHAALAAFAAEYGIAFHTVELEKLDDIDAALVSIAAAVGSAERGGELLRRIRKEVDSVRETCAGLPRLRVLLVLGRSPGDLTGVTTIGPGTFLDDMIAAAGGENVFSDARGRYPQISKESVLVRDPEVILEVNTDGGPQERLERLRSDWARFPEITAVARGRVHCVTDDFLLIPGPRVGQSVRVMAEAIHPEAFHE
ncbi:MAG: helical backbone metal receptor [Candidatus Eisenbacteria bacterium]|nr:helical backbone metal receptor [Candidatus Eisenbacteria bacterium]